MHRFFRRNDPPRQGKVPFAVAVLAGLTAVVTLSSGVLLWQRSNTSGTVPVAVVPDSPTGRTGPILLADVTAKTGITFVHTHGGFGRQYVVEAMSAGVATFDYDGDGWTDIYFLNGAPLGESRPEPPPRNALYRNLGNWRFLDVTQEAGVGDTGYGLGVAVADYDNDGDPDLYLNNFGPNVLYRNNGDGTFSEATREACVVNGTKVGAGVSFFDMDGDGDLDLYVASYVTNALDSNPRRMIGGIARAPSPLDFKPEHHNLYRNNGDGTFADVSSESGVGAQPEPGMGLVAFDADQDGDTDIFVCNDVAPNFLWQNDGQGRFQEIGTVAGVAYDFWGKANGSMGVDSADYDNDALPDLVMTSYQAEMPCLYRSLGQGLFEDVALKAGVGVPCLPHVNWGVGFADFDNDGRRDLYVAHGHLEERIALIDSATAYKVPNSLFWNAGHGRFTDVSKMAGDGMRVTESSRGTCLDDLDNDGDIDVVVLNAQAQPTVLRNETVNGHHWLQIRLVGCRRDSDGVGARVKVQAGDLTLVDEVHSGRGYQSHFGMRLHCGLGERERVQRIEVRWPDGAADVVEDVAVDRLVTIFEGRGR